jgi:hypothetical protein
VRRQRGCRDGGGDVRWLSGQRRGRAAATRRERTDRRARRGKRRLTGGSLMSAIFELKFTPTKIAQNK